MLDWWGSDWFSNLLRAGHTWGYLTARKYVYEPGYDSSKSLIPLYDQLYKYYENIKKQADYEKNTGRTQAYGSSMYTYSNASNLIDSAIRTSKNAVYSVGNLSKRF